MVFGVTTVGAVAQVPKHHFTQKRCNAVPLCAVEFGVREIVDLIHSFRNHRQQLVQVAGRPVGLERDRALLARVQIGPPQPPPHLGHGALAFAGARRGIAAPKLRHHGVRGTTTTGDEAEEGQTAFVVDRLAQELKSYEGSGHRQTTLPRRGWGQPVAKDG